MIAILAFIVSLFFLIAGCGKNQSEAPPGGDQTEAVADSTSKTTADTDSTVSFLKIDKEYKQAQIVKMFSIEPVTNNATPLMNASVTQFPNPFNHNETSALTTIEHQNLKSSSNDLFVNYMTKTNVKLGDQFAAVTPVTKYDIMND
jgi:hypothetical protein